MPRKIKVAPGAREKHARLTEREMLKTINEHLRRLQKTGGNEVEVYLDHGGRTVAMTSYASLEIWGKDMEHAMVYEQAGAGHTPGRNETGHVLPPGKG